MPRKATGGATRYETTDGPRWRIRYLDEGTRKSRGGFPDEETARFALRLIQKGQTDAALALSESDSRERNPAQAKLTIDKWDPRTASIQSFAAHWLDSTTAIAPTTIAGYRRMFDKHINPFIGNYKVSEVDPMMLNKLYASLLESGRLQKRRRTTSRNDDHPNGLAPSTVRAVNTAISSMFTYAQRLGVIDANPCHSPLATPPTSRQAAFEAIDVKPWTASQVRLFLAEARKVEPQLYPLMCLAIATGMRRGELAALRVGAIDLVSGAVSVRRNRVAVERDGHVEVIERATKSGNKRTIRVGSSTVEMLRSHLLAAQVDEGRDMGEDAHVFVTTAGNPWHPNSLTTVWGRTMDRVIVRLRERNIELPRQRLHDLRHFHATYLIGQNENPRIIQERLGHSNITTTMSVYSHVMDEAQIHAGDVADGVFADPDADLEGSLDTPTPREPTSPDLGESTTHHSHIPTNGEAR